MICKNQTFLKYGTIPRVVGKENEKFIVLKKDKPTIKDCKKAVSKSEINLKNELLYILEQNNGFTADEAVEICEQYKVMVPGNLKYCSLDRNQFTVLDKRLTQRKIHVSLFFENLPKDFENLYKNKFCGKDAKKLHITLGTFNMRHNDQPHSILTTIVNETKVPYIKMQKAKIITGEKGDKICVIKNDQIDFLIKSIKKKEKYKFFPESQTHITLVKKKNMTEHDFNTINDRELLSLVEQLEIKGIRTNEFRDEIEFNNEDTVEVFNSEGKIQKIENGHATVMINGLSKRVFIGFIKKPHKQHYHFVLK